MQAPSTASIFPMCKTFILHYSVIIECFNKTGFGMHSGIPVITSAWFVTGWGFNPLWCLSTPPVFIDPHWFSRKYIADPLWFSHKSSTGYNQPCYNEVAVYNYFQHHVESSFSRPFLICKHALNPFHNLGLNKTSLLISDLWLTRGLIKIKHCVRKFFFSKMF